MVAGSLILSLSSRQAGSDSWHFMGENKSQKYVKIHGKIFELPAPINPAQNKKVPQNLFGEASKDFSAAERMGISVN